MKYLILIHQNRNAREQFASFPAEVQAAGLAAYQKLNADLVASGEYVASEALDADTTATVVRGGNGSYVQTDGPFAETKEICGLLPRRRGLTRPRGRDLVSLTLRGATFALPAADDLSRDSTRWPR